MILTFEETLNSASAEKPSPKLAPAQPESSNLASAAKPTPTTAAAKSGLRSTPDLWLNSVFFTRVLPQKERLASKLQAPPQVAQTPRAALNEAIVHQANLPLPAHVFFTGNMDKALGCEQALFITLESVNAAPDPNRQNAPRVDFFVYHTDGSVERYHPGHRPQADAFVHRMPPATSAFNLQMAQNHGVGWALHVHPPSLAVLENPHTVPDGLILVHSLDLAYISPLDAKLVSPILLSGTLQSIADGTLVDWSHQGFPWWVLIAGRPSKFLQMLEDGILSVVASRHGVTITTRFGDHFLTVKKGKLKVSKQSHTVHNPSGSVA